MSAPHAEGEIPTLDTVATVPLQFPDFSKTFQHLRTDAQKVFDMRDMERWLDTELEPHTVEVGDLTMARDIESMAADAAREEDEKLLERAKEVGQRIEESRDHISKYFNLGKAMETETQWRLREEEVAARERVVFEHQAREASLLADLNQRFGILQKVPHDPFSWTVEWSLAPQEFTVNVTSLRGLRAKQRDGYYVFLCSVVDRVGGSTLRFSTGGQNKDCTAALPPLRFKEDSAAVDRYINRSVEMLCPAPALLQTHAVLLIEFWQLRVGKYDPCDEVAGFAYWPLVDRDYRVREGKFKVPLVVGETDPSLDTYRQIGHVLENGLQSWLGNVYFEIKGITRNRNVQEEVKQDLGGFGETEEKTAHDMRLEKTADDIRSLTFPHLPARMFFDDVKLGDEGDEDLGPVGKIGSDLRDMNASLWEKRKMLEEEKKSLHSEIVKRKSRSLAMDANDDDEVTELQMRRDLAAKGKTKRKLNELATADGDDEGKMRDSHVLVQQHHFAQASQREFFFLGRRWRDKANVGLSVVLYDLGVNVGGPWDKTLVVTNLVMFIIGWIAEMIVHAVAKYLYLGFLDVPISYESWAPWHVDIRFEFTSRFYPEDTLGTLSIGFAVAICFFFFMAFVFFVLLKIFDAIPYTMTRFAMWYGVACALDPISTAIAEAASGNLASGDPFLLYNQFQREEGTGIHGALLTAVLYIAMSIPLYIAMYTFAIYVHLNGRALDIYDRLTYPETSFFVPHDLEIGEVELSEIIEDAKSHRTETGDIKRVIVHDVKYHYICLFRERLFKLLNIMSNNPDEWVSSYFDRIALRRPRHAESLIVDNLGSFKLGRDILLFMQRNFPHLCLFSRERIGDVGEDHYYESELMRGIHSHSTLLEDDLEMREFMKNFFACQVSGEKPVEWCYDDPTGRKFIIKDADLLADLIFFESSGDLYRFGLLYLWLTKKCNNAVMSGPLRKVSPDDPESWITVSMDNFVSTDQFRSTEGDLAEGVIVHIIRENLARGNKSLERAFVVTPFGAVFEPTQSSFSMQTHHTADHIEFWAAKAVLMGMQFEEELAASASY